MVNKWTFYLTKKRGEGGLCCVLMLSASLKENISIWGLHRLMYSFFSDHDRTQLCYVLPGQLIPPWIWCEYEAVFTCSFTRFCEFTSLRLALCLRGWKELQSVFLPKPSPYAEPPPAPAPESGTAGSEVLLFSSNWLLCAWWLSHAAPNVYNKDREQKNGR